MSTNQPDITTPDGENKRFKDAQTDKRNHEHLTNENDEISEADIRNIETNVEGKKTDSIADGDEGADMVDDKLIGDDLEERKIKDDSDPQINTPWNILGS